MSAPQGKPVQHQVRREPLCPAQVLQHTRRFSSRGKSSAPLGGLETSVLRQDEGPTYITFFLSFFNTVFLGGQVT